MDMRTELFMYEALTDIGVKPDLARKVERQLEAAIDARQEIMRTEWREQLMTKADGAQMEARLLKVMSDQHRWTIGTLVAVSGLVVALIKLI